MLLTLSNTPRDYAWGSMTAIAELEGREPSGRPEAEVWFGDHPASPALVGDGTGRALDEWIATEGPAHGVSEPLPYLLKILAAASPLSIQVHPSLSEARAGFAREEAAGIARDAATRTYRDANHKPEIIVSIGDEFLALAGFRDVAATRRLLASIPGSGAEKLATRLTRPDELGAVVADLLTGSATAEVMDILAHLDTASSVEFAGELEAARRILAAHPSDPGVVVALLLNLVRLGRGEAIFVPAGMPHAYLRGIGVELMAASDNVLRGGLTSKHIDVGELLSVLVARPQEVPIMRARREPGALMSYDGIEADDFALGRIERSDADAPTVVGVPTATIVLAVEGAPRVSQGPDVVELVAGAACFATPGEQLTVTGSGAVFIARPGR